MSFERTGGKAEAILTYPVFNPVIFQALVPDEIVTIGRMGVLVRLLPLPMLVIR